MRRAQVAFRKVAALSLLATAFLLVVDALPSDAGGRHHHGRHHGHGRHHHGHGRFFISVGPAFYWGAAYPYWWHSPPPYYVYSPPPVVVQEPAYAQAAPAPAAPAPEGYWYYCASAGAYYPTVPSCAEAWVKVPPRAE